MDLDGGKAGTRVPITSDHVFNVHIHILLIKINIMIYICYIIHRGKG